MTTSLNSTAKLESSPNYYQSIENITSLENPRAKENIFLSMINNTFLAKVGISFHFSMMILTSLYAFYLAFKPVRIPRNDPANFQNP